MAVSERAACLINKYAIRSQEECSPSATEPGEATGAQRPRLLPLRDAMCTQPPVLRCWDVAIASCALRRKPGQAELRTQKKPCTGRHTEVMEHAPIYQAAVLAV